MKKNPNNYILTNENIVACNDKEVLFIEVKRKLGTSELGAQLSGLGNFPISANSALDISKLPTKEEYFKDKWEKTEWIPFATVQDSMPRRATQWPEYLIIHWTAGRQSQTGVNGIKYGASQGHTYCFLQADGKLFQGAPTNAGGYHLGNASVSSYASLGVETACAGKVEKIGEKFVPWFAKDPKTGAIIEKDCIPKSQILYDADDTSDDASFKGYYQTFTPDQLKTLLKLAVYCVQVLSIKVSNIRGHDEVATPKGRKCDPGASIGPGGMVQFRKEVQKLLDQGTPWDVL